MGFRIIAAGVLTISIVGCASHQTLDSEHSVSLAQAHENYFRIGAAIDENSYKTHANLLKQHFNSLTTENEMKFESLQPTEGEFSFATADAMLKFAHQNRMATRGHALVWHRQTPEWVFLQEDGSPAPADLVKARMANHIQKVMTHFAGKVDYWDVVNEAIMDDGALRTHTEEKDDQKSPWFGALGEQYIEDAFRLARAADPKAKLYYNDYYNYLPARRDAIYALLKGLIEKGVPIDGVGLQCHLNVEPSSKTDHQSYHQTIESLETTIQLYGSLGLDVQITELDVSLYIGGNQYTPADFFTPESLSEQQLTQQANRYRELFEMFRRNGDIISNVTFWGIADDNTWLSEFDSGRQDFPMLFDTQHLPKPAFHAVMEFSAPALAEGTVE